MVKKNFLTNGYALVDFGEECAASRIMPNNFLFENKGKMCLRMYSLITCLKI